MVWPRIVPDTVVYSLVWVACTLCSKLPDRPAIAVFRVEEGDELVEGVAVGSLRVGLGRSRTVYVSFNRSFIGKSTGRRVGKMG